MNCYNALAEHFRWSYIDVQLFFVRGNLFALRDSMAGFFFLDVYDTGLLLNLAKYVFVD
jgi:hypothetical protein